MIVPTDAAMVAPRPRTPVGRLAATGKMRRSGGRSPWRGLWRDRSGASALEFAFIMPVLLLFVGGIIQFGAVFFVESNMANVARDAARRISTGQYDELQAETFARDRLAYWGATFNVDAQLLPDPVNPTETEITVEISVPLADAAIIDLLGLFNSGTLRARAVMHQE